MTVDSSLGEVAVSVHGLLIESNSDIVYGMKNFKIEIVKNRRDTIKI